MSKANWEVNLCWVKAHAGIMGNELADTLAKKAAKNEACMYVCMYEAAATD